MSVKEEQSTSILNSFVFLTTFAVDFGFTGMCVTSCGERDIIKVSVIACEGPDLYWIMFHKNNIKCLHMTLFVRLPPLISNYLTQSQIEERMNLNSYGVI